MGSDADLAGEVLAELRAIRSARGKLTPQKLARYPMLMHVLGADDLLDAFFAFRRELRRYAREANRDEAAAAQSIYADAETVIQRLDYTAIRLSDDELRDQRTARRWSDAGMPALAEDLVYLARVRGRLGREMLSIELDAGPGHGLLLTIDQIVQVDLDVRAPEVTLWTLDTDGDPRQISIDLELYPATETNDGENRLIRQRVLLDGELMDRITPEHGLVLAVTGRDAPMRTISFEDRWSPPREVVVRLSAHRTRAAVELARERNDAYQRPCSAR